MFKDFVKDLCSVILLCLCGATMGATIPDIEGNVSSWGFTRIDFCQNTGQLYAFTGLNLYCYNPAGNDFEIALRGAGSVTSKQWDPADFAFGTDGSFAALPTGYSLGFVKADMPSGPAVEKTSLNQRMYYSTASRFRDNQLYANGDANGFYNVLFRLDMAGNGSETVVTPVSNTYAGGIAFDAADNLYIADFTPYFDGTGLGDVDIYRISRTQLDTAAADSNYVFDPQLIVSKAILAGSDSIVLDGDYNIYVSSYVGVAKIMPTADPNIFTVSDFAGDIDANPFAAPPEIFSGITADIRAGMLYFGKSVMQNSVYGPYNLQQLQIPQAADWSADLDGNGIINLADLEIYSEDYLSSGSYISGDLSDDSTVNLRDFAIFAKQWKKKAPWHGGN